jgi:O-methyltransferase
MQRDINAMDQIATGRASRLDDRYLQFMKQCLTRYLYPDRYRPLQRPSYKKNPITWMFYPALVALLKRKGLEICRYQEFDGAARTEGKDWPAEADTMIGLKRLDNLHACIETVIQDRIPGDFIETGVWRGGACIFMRAALEAYGDIDRAIWVADSFEGLPKPDGRYRQDDGDLHWTISDTLAISLDQVKANFSRYGLLDDRVHFLKGWFKDTLPTAPIEQLAIMRLDGDMYSSTMDALISLYPKLSKGGFAIIDDYGAVEACRKAVTDFRDSNKIGDPLQVIDWTGVYWRKS